MGVSIQVLRSYVIQENKNTDITQKIVIIKKIDIIEPEESLINNVSSYLGIEVSEITSVTRLGRCKSESTLPKAILVQLRNEYKVGKLLARASMLQNYEDNYH